jgi:hypothetical protein
MPRNSPYRPCVEILVCVATFEMAQLSGRLDLCV